MNVVNREVVAPRRIRSKLSAVIAALILAGLVVHADGEAGRVRAGFAVAGLEVDQGLVREV